MTLFGNYSLTKWSGIFISQCIKNNKIKYAFGRKAFSERLKEQIILLPIDKNAEPDYKFMENFIKQEIKKQILKIIDYFSKYTINN